MCFINDCLITILVGRIDTEVEEHRLKDDTSPINKKMAGIVFPAILVYVIKIMLA
ncbi:hypothetical protein SAMN04487890_11759 [Mucilaginibacter polytrichastri]|nr:hypothetical protein SAMN04487890_11759 [Mucilaginibacter polytrichastri]